MLLPMSEVLPPKNPQNGVFLRHQMKMAVRTVRRAQKQRCPQLEHFQEPYRNLSEPERSSYSLRVGEASNLMPKLERRAASIFSSAINPPGQAAVNLRG